jgi:hypothetical protein
MKSLTFVFVGATILSTLLGSAEASHLSSKHARMMKKRATSVFDPVAPNAPVLGVGQDPNQNPTPKNVANNSVSVSGTAAAGQVRTIEIFCDISTNDDLYFSRQEVTSSPFLSTPSSAD